VERKRANQRRYVYSARRDPITHVAHQGDELVAGSWNEVYAITEWRPKPLTRFERDWLEKYCK